MSSDRSPRRIVRQPVGSAARLLGWTPPPETASSAVRRHNYVAIQLESAAMGVANAAGIYLPVFLVRLGATNFEISLLTAIPALTGFLLAIPIGNWLQSRRNVVPWYSRSRGLAQLVYVAAAIAVLFVPPQQAVLIILGLWALVTLPSTIGMVAFYSVMDGAAGPRGRYDLLSMRWSVMGLTTAVTVAIAGQLLEVVAFPLNYQIVFVAFSVAGLAAAYYASRIRLPDHPPVVVREAGVSVRTRLRDFADMLGSHRPFLGFVLRHFVFTFGTRLAVPLIPLWYIREAHASDAWIGIIGTGQSLTLLFGYNLWRRQSRRRNPRLLVVLATIGAVLYPVVMSFSTDLVAIAVITAYGALVYAGVDLVLFDLMMRTIPSRYSLTFSAVETSIQNLASIIGPLLGGVIADLWGIGIGLLVAGVVTLAGALLFALSRFPTQLVATTTSGPAPPPVSPQPAPAPTPGSSGPPAAEPRPNSLEVDVDPNPNLLPDAPLEVLEARTLFRSDAVRRRGAACLRRLDSGRLLMAFLIGTGPEHVNDGAVVLTSSDDEGRTWDEPFPVYAVPGWDSLPLGGIAHVRDDLLHLIVGRVKYDPSLGGDEPFAGWFAGATTSRDGGRSWSDVTDEIKLYPMWTEFYGASNPFPRSDGRLIWTVIGTKGRDVEWMTGVSTTGPEDLDFTPPVIIAADPSKNFADTDLLRLDGGKFIAVIREMVEKEGWIAFSDDEARTWHGLRKVGFRASNIKLFRLADGTIVCAYRDEDPARYGVSVSTSGDGGRTWQPAGQLYSDPAARHQPGSLCGYPDMVSLGNGEIAAVLHTYADAGGRADLQFFRLRDRTAG